MRSPLWDDHTTRPETGWTSRRHRIRAFGPAPSGDLIHHPHEADGVSWQLGPGDLATDLLHHGHKVRGVGLGSECLTPRSRHKTSTKPNLLPPRDRQTWRFVATDRLQPRAVSHCTCPLLRPHRIAFLNPPFREGEAPCEPSQRSASDPIRLVRIGEAGRRLRRSLEQRARPHPACLDR
jgi:hypothetical protein